MASKVDIGRTYRAIVTGFEGLCIGKCTYLTGCDRAGIQPRTLDKDGKPQDSIWFDESELVLVDVPIVVLDTEPVVYVQIPDYAMTKTRKGGPGRYDPSAR